MINEDKFILQSILERKNDLFSESNIKIIETSVNIYHIAAALGAENVSRQIRCLPNWYLKRCEIKTGLFQLPPYVIAVLKGREKLQRYVDSWGNIDSLTGWGRHLNETLLHVTDSESDLLRADIIPMYELYITKRCFPPLKMIFNASAQTAGLDGFLRIYEYLFKNNLTSELEEILSQICVTAQNFMHPSSRIIVVGPGNDISGIVNNILAIAKLSVVYDAESIFQKSVQMLSKELLRISFGQNNRKALLNICGAFQRQNLQKILQDRLYTEPSSILPSDAFSTFMCLYNLLIDYPQTVDKIKNVMAQIPDIDTIINAPFSDTRYVYVRECLGLTPLQAYVLQYNKVDVSVVRALVDLGADIDVIFPPNLLIYRYTKLFAGRNRETTPAGQSLMMYILNEERGFKGNFRQLLEFFLYENANIELNKSAVATCLEMYKLQGILCISSTPAPRCACFIVDKQETSIATATYSTDVTIHEIPGYHTAQLLIEAGFPYSCEDIDKVLHTDAIMEYNEFRKRSSQTRESYHATKTKPDITLLKYLKKCVSKPRSLKLRCRDVLRGHFPKRQIHKYVSCVEMQDEFRDFLLLKPILHSLSKGYYP